MIRLPISFLIASFVMNALVPRTTAAQALGAAIDRVFTNWSSSTTPGCVVGVRRGIETMYVRAYGMANLEHRSPLMRETVLEVGPVAEQFTAAAVVLLTQQGKLSLEDDVRKYIGELPDFGSVITIRHLLTHTSGLRDSESLLLLRGRVPGRVVYTIDEILHVLGRQRSLNFVPGSEQLRSTSEYMLAALIVERVSGQSLAAFTDEHFFKPLGMTSTQWRGDHRRVVRGRATAYHREGSGFVEDMPYSMVQGQEGLLSTVDDLLTWNYALITGRLEGGRELVTQLETLDTLSGGATTTYGFGLMIGSFKGTRELYHTGRSAGYASYLTLFPDPQLSVAVLCNAGESEPLAYGRQVAALLLPPSSSVIPAARPAPTASVPVDGARLARLAGQYLDPARDRTMQIVARGSTLVVGDVVFAPTTATTFANDSAGRLDFELDDNRVRRLTTSLLGIRTAWSPAPRTAPSAEELRIYEGSYASAELGVDYVVRITEGHLEIGFDPRRGRLPFAFVFDRAEPLAPRYPDGFQVGDSGITLRFVRDRDRKVRGLRLFMERARNLEFVRVP